MINSNFYDPILICRLPVQFMSKKEVFLISSFLGNHSSNRVKRSENGVLDLTTRTRKFEIVARFGVPRKGRQLVQPLLILLRVSSPVCHMIRYDEHGVHSINRVSRVR